MNENLGSYFNALGGTLGSPFPFRDEGININDTGILVTDDGTELVTDDGTQLEYGQEV